MTATNDNPLCDIGFIGLGVMGKNLCLNLADHGYRIACLDLNQNKVDAMLQQDALELQGQTARMQGCNSYQSLLASLKAPFVIMLSVPAGEAVDHVCFNLIKAGVKPEDIVIDTGNSLWTDSIEREKKYADDFCFFSTAVSGGEVGARFGPSLMPSGNAEAWQRIEPIFHAIAAKVDPDTGLPIESNQPGKPVTQGEPCATLIGPIGAGHYVKMVHNGIEYADMQIICEAYHIMRSALSMAPQEIAQVFRQWNDGILNSYLMQISASVLEHVDPDSQQPLVDVILDVAGQKGTGVWTGVSALEIGSPAQTINQAVMARSLSALKNERVLASQCLAGPQPAPVTPEQKQTMIEALKQALYCSKVCAYAQGFQLMAQAGEQYQWTLNFAEIAKIWRAGCIIRANFTKHQRPMNKKRS